MKYIFKWFLILMTLSVSPTMLAADIYVGIIDAKTLHKNYDDFSSEYLSYMVKNSDVDMLKNIKEPITITVLFGTWCHDSQREVPRLNKLLEAANNHNITTTLIAVDRDKKIDEHYQLEYTPTIILYRENIEIGRIVERPNKTIAQDIAGIVFKH